MISTEQLKSEAEAMRAGLVATRRDFHAHPELGFQEVRTAGIVAKRLAELGYETQSGVGKTGVVGVLEGASPDGETLLLRFDMDALPIEEQVDVPFKSLTPGVMHACGHDAHTAIGLGVAELLARHRDQWKGIAKFVFQPAEEIVSGALAMIADGVLEHPKATRSLSMHVSSKDRTGTVLMTDGPTMAIADKFEIIVRGRGSHGASPHYGADPIVAGAQIVSALQTIVARNVDPLDESVVTVGYFHGGTVGNIIPDKVTMGGTMRSFKDEVALQIRQRMTEIAQGIAKALGCEATLWFPEIYNPATVNDPKMAEVVRGRARELVGPDNMSADHRTMGAEDAAHFLKAAPGAYVFIGAGVHDDEDKNEPHHSPRFEINEDALPISVALVTGAALDMLAKNS